MRVSKNLAWVAGLCAAALAVARLHATETPPSSAGTQGMATNQPASVAEGHRLYLLNCAHCHAVDASGDEGPDLHGVTKSDAKIALMVRNGVKGKMPKFGSKLSEADIRALVAYVRSLGDP